jgi:molecular chaperone DnaJ
MQTVPITYLEAILGCVLEVKLFDGSYKKIKIPAGTQYGAQFRVKGAGIPLFKSDMIVKVEVLIPVKISRKEKSLLEELQKLTKDNPRN